MKKNTMCVQGGYEPKNGEPRVTPICQSTTYKYDSSETVGKLFDLEEKKLVIQTRNNVYKGLNLG